MNKLLSRKLYLKSFVLLGICLIIFLFGFSEKWVLTYYSNGIYPILSMSLRWVSSLVPFALGDILYGFLVLLAVYRIILFFRKAKRKQFKREDRLGVPLQLMNVLLILYISFKLLWGLNYSRPSINEQLKIADQKYSIKELVQLGNFFINKVNDLQPKVNYSMGYQIADLSRQAAYDYHRMEFTDPLFRYHIGSIKPVLNDWMVSKSGIEGYYNPLSGEANVNMRLLPWTLPFVTCHEMSHQIGIAKEDEANLVAYLVGSSSKDLNFQYSVNYTMLRYILFEIRFKSPTDYLAMRERINARTIANFKAENLFWQKYNGQMSDYMGLAFDKFLKLNNQKRGLKSYQNIVIWLWNYHKKEFVGFDPH